MAKKVKRIAKNLENVLSGQPWYGRAVYEILNEIDESKVNEKPNNNSHSLLELLWHMNTWSEFTLANLENRSEEELKAIEKNDWRELNPEIHTWQKGMDELKSIHKKIIEILHEKDDDFLKDIVPNRKFNYRFMLNGLIQHNIYHLGQIAYLKKQLD